MIKGAQIKLLKTHTAKDNGIPIVDGYWVIGVLRQDIVIGEVISVDRSENSLSGKVEGRFTSSRVRDVIPVNDKEVIVCTENSTYRVSLYEKS